MRRRSVPATTFTTAVLTLVAATAAGAEPAPPRNCVRVEAFVRPGSPQSDAAAEFLRSLSDRPGLAIEIKDVSTDAAAAERVKKLLVQYRAARPGLPVVHACGQLIVGFRDAATTGARLEKLWVLDAYVRDGCPHCADGKRFLERVRKNYPGFTIRYHEIVKDPKSRDRLMEIARSRNVTVANVPAFDLCGRLVVGYDRDETTGRRIEDLLRGACVPCPAKEEAAPIAPPSDPPSRPSARFIRPTDALVALSLIGQVPSPDAEASTAPSGDEAPAADSSLQDLPLDDIPLEDLPEEEVIGPAEAGGTADERSAYVIDLPVFGEVDARELGLPLFTIAVGLVDGFNPCAMWVLLFLLSILVNLQDRWRILAVAGTFVVISGLAYYAFMAAWLNVFLLVGFLRPAQIALGLLAVFVGSVHVKDFFAFHKGITLSIPESAKPGIYARVRKIVNAEHVTGAVLGASVLAVLVNVVELLCTAGLPALYTQVLTLRQLPAWANYAYLALYILAYMADDSLMVGLVVITLGKRKMQERHGRWLKLVSGLAVLLLGLVLLFKPEWLV